MSQRLVLLVIITLSFIAAADSGTMSPDTDAGNQWDVTGTSEHYEAVDEGVDSVDYSDYVHTQTPGENEIFEVGSITLPQDYKVVELSIMAYGRADPTLNAQASIYVGEWSIEKPFEFGSTPSLRSVTWRGIWGQEEVDNLRLKVTSTGTGSQVDVYNIQAQATYWNSNSVLTLDAGNDTDIEWSTPMIYSGPHRLDFTDHLNRYIRGGCWCVGCVYDRATGNCTIPVVIDADEAANITVNDVSLIYGSSKTLAEVGYGNSFRRSDGGCWVVEHPGGLTWPPAESVPSSYSECTEIDHTYTQANHERPATDDAVDDAMYRLLTQKLDQDPPEGVVDIEVKENMSFEAQGKIGVQTMWGPLNVRLIVWS